MCEDNKLRELILALMARLERLPTEDEVMLFIQGTHEDRMRIWNTEV